MDNKIIKQIVDGNDIYDIGVKWDNIELPNGSSELSADKIKETAQKKFITPEEKNRISIINGDNKIDANKIVTSGTQQFVSQAEKNEWGGKQDKINKDNKLSADLIKTDNSHQFMTQNDKERLDNILRDGKINHHIDADKVDTNENYQFITEAEKNSLNNLNDFYNKEHNNLERVANRSSSLIFKENIDTKYPTVKAMREYVQDIVGQYSNSWNISWERNKKFVLTPTQDQIIKEDTNSGYYYVGEVSLFKDGSIPSQIKASTFLQNDTDVAFVLSTEQITTGSKNIDNNTQYFQKHILNMNIFQENYKYLYIIAQGEKINDDNYLKPSENPNIRVVIDFAIPTGGSPATYSYTSVVCKSKISPNRISEDDNKQFVSKTEKDVWNGKQNNINENNKLSANLINQTTNLRFVTDNEKDKIAEAYRATQDDFYTKEQTYDRDAIDEAIQHSVASVYIYKGSVENLDALESIESPRVGDVYNVVESYNSNYAWNGEQWDNLGNDLSSYELKSDKITNLIDSAIISDESKKSPTTRAIKDYIRYNNAREYLNWTNNKYLSYETGSDFSISSLNNSSGLYVSDPISLNQNETVTVQTYLGNSFSSINNFTAPCFAAVVSEIKEENKYEVKSYGQIKADTGQWGILTYSNNTDNILQVYVCASQTLDPAIKPQNNPDITIQISNSAGKIKRIYNSSTIKANRIVQDDDNYQFVSSNEKSKWNSILGNDGKIAKHIPVDLVDTNQQNQLVSQEQIDNWSNKQDVINEDNKITSNLIDDESQEQKFVTEEEKYKWNEVTDGLLINPGGEQSLPDDERHYRYKEPKKDYYFNKDTGIETYKKGLNATIYYYDLSPISNQQFMTNHNVTFTSSIGSWPNIPYVLKNPIENNDETNRIVSETTTGTVTIKLRDLLSDIKNGYTILAIMGYNNVTPTITITEFIPPQYFTKEKYETDKQELQNNINEKLQKPNSIIPDVYSYDSDNSSWKQKENIPYTSINFDLSNDIEPKFEDFTFEENDQIVGLDSLISQKMTLDITDDQIFFDKPKLFSYCYLNQTNTEGTRKLILNDADANKKAYILTAPVQKNDIIKIYGQSNLNRYQWFFVKKESDSSILEKSNNEIGFSNMIIPSADNEDISQDKKREFIYTIKVPDNVSHIIISGYIYLPRIYKMTGFQKKRPWSGKKWCVIGDSLTEKNAMTFKNYADYISDATGIEVINLGLSGSGYKKRFNEEQNNAFFGDRLNNFEEDIDVVTIIGGVNDATIRASYQSIDLSEICNNDGTFKADEVECIEPDTIYKIGNKYYKLTQQRWQEIDTPSDSTSATTITNNKTLIFNGDIYRDTNDTSSYIQCQRNSNGKWTFSRIAEDSLLYDELENKKLFVGDTLDNLEDDESYKIDNMSLMGCVNKLINRLEKNRPDIQIGIMSSVPIETYNMTKPEAVRFVNALEKLCRYRNIPFLNLFYSSNLRAWDQSVKRYLYTRDSATTGPHPSERAHKLFAPKIKNFLNNFIL